MEEEFESTGVNLSGRKSSTGSSPIKNFFSSSLPAPIPQKQPSDVVSLDAFESVLLRASSSSSSSSTKHQQCENERKNALQQAKFRYLCNKIH